MFRSAVFLLCVLAIEALPSPKNATIVAFSRKKGPRIINGEEAKPGQFPYQVGLHMNGATGGWFCGGSLISNEWILTAGHCLDGAHNGVATTGSTNINEGLVTDLSQGVLHEGYDPEYLANDIALVKLSSPLTFDANTSSVSLSSQPLEVNVEVTVSGWGLTQESNINISETLNFAHLVTISNNDCNRIYGIIVDGMVCALSNSGEVKGVCDGDSGGPLTINSDSGPEHFVSTFGCASGDPNGYTRTAYYRDWIRDNTGV